MTQHEARVGFLVALADGEVAQRVGKRLDLTLQDPPRAAALKAPQTVSEWLTDAPASAVLWMVEEGDREINQWVHVYYHRIDRRDWGQPYQEAGLFGGVEAGINAVKRLAPRHASSRRRVTTAMERDPELVEKLRAVRSMRRGWTESSRLGDLTPDDWTVIAAADRKEPLPGYARWALAVRIDCPPEVREQFGSLPRFARRLRQAGIVSGPREYVEEYAPASSVLAVLDLGRTLFPTRLAEAADVLRPLVRSGLGGDEEAWAVLAQLLPSFRGTVPELIATAGAVGGGPR